jgi:hypothetical protein
VYCPNDSGVRKTFIKDIDPYVTDESLTEKTHILTGDFNCVLDKEIDRYPSRNYDDTGGKELKTIMTKNNLIDIWREKNPSKPLPLAMPLLHDSNYFRIHQNFSTSFAMILFQKMYSASLEHILHFRKGKGPNITKCNDTVLNVNIFL